MGSVASDMCLGFDDLNKIQKTSVTTKTTTTTNQTEKKVAKDGTYGAKLVAPVKLHYHLRVIAGGSWASSHPARAKAVSLRLHTRKHSFSFFVFVPVRCCTAFPYESSEWLCCREGFHFARSLH